MGLSSLRNVGAVTSKELKTYFVSPIAYVFTALMILVVGFFGLNSAISSGSPNLRATFDLTTLFLLFLLPLLTMRLLAEERRMGSLELLLTSPVRDWEVVVGKFLGSYVLFLAMTSYIWLHALALNLLTQGTRYVHIFGISTPLHNIDFGPMVSGYLGVLLLGAMLLALGLFLSSLTQNQVVAAVSGIVAGLVIYYLSVLERFFPASTGSGPGLSSFFAYAAGITRFEALAGGEVAWREVVYFLSFTLAFLFFTVRVLEARRYA